MPMMEGVVGPTAGYQEQQVSSRDSARHTDTVS